MAGSQESGLRWESPLRDLAQRLMATARAHMAYSQVVELMRVVDAHINAMARIEEINKMESNNDNKPGDDQGRA